MSATGFASLPSSEELVAELARSMSELVFAVPVVVDSTPPAIGNFSPAPGSVIAGTTTVVFDVTDDGGSFRRVIVTALFPRTGIEEVVHDGDGFRGLYSVVSSRVIIAGGFRYNVTRSGGWPSSPEFKVFAIDPAGNEGLV